MTCTRHVRALARAGVLARVGGPSTWDSQPSVRSSERVPISPGAVTSPEFVPATSTPWYVKDGSGAERRLPGTLLLNMLIKNEREHLLRTLPAWAKIVDAWVLGVDDANEDDSEEVARRIMGERGVPGVVVKVHFDGMGPTWTKLIEEGYARFPNISHGILADADFAPHTPPGGFDKMELDVRCSKHIVNIWDGDGLVSRRLDWVYRNTPGARVERRTHQALRVPALPGQEVYVTELHTLELDERPGGYQDRTGGARGKAQRYVRMLEADLRDFGPNDTRSLYYIGIGNMELLQVGLREAGYDLQRVTAEDRAALNASISAFLRRVAIPGHDAGSREERYWALIKLGELHERFVRDGIAALSFYLHAARLDPPRADAWFYAGQCLRLAGNSRAAVPLLRTAAGLPLVDRAFFHWPLLYTCMAKIELARAVATVVTSVLDDWDLSPSADAATVSPSDLSAPEETDWSTAVRVAEHVARRLWLLPRRITLADVDAALQTLQVAKKQCPSTAAAAEEARHRADIPRLEHLLHDIRRNLTPVAEAEATRKKSNESSSAERTAMRRRVSPLPLPYRGHDRLSTWPSECGTRHPEWLASKATCFAVRQAARSRAASRQPDTCTTALERLCS